MLLFFSVPLSVLPEIISHFFTVVFFTLQTNSSGTFIPVVLLCNYLKKGEQGKLLVMCRPSAKRPLPPLKVFHLHKNARDWWQEVVPSSGLQRMMQLTSHREVPTSVLKGGKAGESQAPNPCWPLDSLFLVGRRSGDPLQGAALRSLVTFGSPFPPMKSPDP